MLIKKGSVTVFKILPDEAKTTQFTAQIVGKGTRIWKKSGTSLICRMVHMHTVLMFKTYQGSMNQTESRRVNVTVRSSQSMTVNVTVCTNR